MRKVLRCGYASAIVAIIATLAMSREAGGETLGLSFGCIEGLCVLNLPRYPSGEFGASDRNRLRCIDISHEKLDRVMAAAIAAKKLVVYRCSGEIGGRLGKLKLASTRWNDGQPLELQVLNSLLRDVEAKFEYPPGVLPADLCVSIRDRYSSSLSKCGLSDLASRDGTCIPPCQQLEQSVVDSFGVVKGLSITVNPSVSAIVTFKRDYWKIDINDGHLDYDLKEYLRDAVEKYVP